MKETDRDKAQRREPLDNKAFNPGTIDSSRETGLKRAKSIFIKKGYQSNPTYTYMEEPDFYRTTTNGYISDLETDPDEDCAEHNYSPYNH
ncbi:hypothetical protein Trydic_g11407 [Trypoxylus dichotomus]